MTAPESETSKRKVKAGERAKQAVAFRIAGASFANIGERLGISAQAAYGLVSRSMEKTRKATLESAETLRAMELTRLDAMQTAIWSDAMKGDEQKIDRLLRIQARRAALLGLDAPTKQEVKVSDADIDGAIVAELARLSARGQAKDASPTESHGQPERPPAVDASSAPGANSATGPVVSVANPGGPGVGQDAHGGGVAAGEG